MASRAFGIRTAGSPVQRAGLSEVPFEGRDAVIGQFRRLAADWGQQRVSDVEVIADRGDWVVVTFRWEVEGDKSGADSAASFAAAYRVSDRRISEAHFRWTPDQALEAAGLRE